MASSSTALTPPSPDILPEIAGVAPWERVGETPNDSQSKSRADKWKQVAIVLENKEREAARKERHAERRRRRVEAEEKMQQQLESTARRMYYAGFFALPFVWLVNLVYFHKEHKSDNASPAIKKCTSPYFFPLRTTSLSVRPDLFSLCCRTVFNPDYRNSRIMLIIYTLIFVAWFTIFQVKKDSLRSLNILAFKGTSPGGI